MGEFNIRVEDLKQDLGNPVAKAIVLLKTLIADEDVISDLDLALTEAVANVVRHAYPGDTTGPLSLCIRTVRGESVTMTITDQGRGLSCAIPSRTLPAPEAEHGRGIPLMTSLCDRVDFRCRGKDNMVIMTKAVPPGAWRD